MENLHNLDNLSLSEVAEVERENDEAENHDLIRPGKNDIWHWTQFGCDEGGDHLR